LDFEIYVDKSRVAVEKNIKELKQERINKSPAKGRN
jgi:biotin operon repressor